MLSMAVGGREASLTLCELAEVPQLRAGVCRVQLRDEILKRARNVAHDLGVLMAHKLV